VKIDLKKLLPKNSLGFYNLFIKPLTLWTSELSKKSPFLHWYWLPVFSSGQTQTSSQLQMQQPLVKLTAVQEDQTTQHVSSRKKTPLNNKLSYEPRNIWDTIYEDLNLRRAQLRIFNGLYTFWVNRRLRWGMILLMIISPLIKFAYMPLPVEGFGEYFVNTSYIQIPNTIEGPDTGWYWGLVRMYIFSNGEMLAPLISILGIFFLFPKNYYPSYLIGVPFGYYAGLSFHRLFFVDSSDAFHSGWSVSMTLMFIILGVVAFIISDKVLFRQNHIKRAAEARIIGLINMPGIEWEDKEELIKKEASVLMKIDNELFIKETA